MTRPIKGLGMTQNLGILVYFLRILEAFQNSASEASTVVDRCKNKHESILANTYLRPTGYRVFQQDVDNGLLLV